MILELLKESDKKVLGRLAVEFGDDFLNNSDEKRVIGLYGIENKEILNFFKQELRNYLLRNKKNIPIVVGEASYNIDIGYFNKIGYFNGLNKDLDGLIDK